MPVFGLPQRRGIGVEGGDASHLGTLRCDILYRTAARSLAQGSPQAVESKSACTMQSNAESRGLTVFPFSHDMLILEWMPKAFFNSSGPCAYLLQHRPGMLTSMPAICRKSSSACKAKENLRQVSRVCFICAYVCMYICIYVYMYIYIYM